MRIPLTTVGVILWFLDDWERQMASVSIIRLDHDAASFRRAASRCRDARASRRMLALALVLEGQSRTAAARACGMDRQTLCDWVHHYNASGLPGLHDRREGQGAKPRLSLAQQEQVAAWVRAGPDRAVDGVVRWRCVDLARRIGREFGVSLAERTVGALLKRLGFRRLSARPHHPRRDVEAQEAHKKTSPRWSTPPSPSMHATKPLSSGGRTKPVSVNKAA